MSLIRCNECGKEISDTTSKCPNCGFELKRENRQLRKGSIIQIIANSLMLLVIIAIIIVSNCGAENSNPSVKGGVKVTVGLAPEVINLLYVYCLFISIIIGIILLILNILALNNKIKTRIYKIVIIALSIIQLITSIMSLFGFMCCGIIYFIFPVINMVGALIIATSKE